MTYSFPSSLASPSSTAASPWSPSAPPSSASETWSQGTQEMLDALPQGWSRSVLYMMLGFSVIAVPWGMMARIDEVGVAQGRLEPQGKTLRLDAAVGGTVAKVHLKEGDRIQAGEPLLELDSATVQADLEQAQTQREGQLNRLAQLELMRNQLELALRTLGFQRQAQIAEQQTQIHQIQQQLEYQKSDRQILQSLWQQDQAQAERYQSLYAMGVLSKLEAEKAQRTALETQQRLQLAQATATQTQAELEKQTQTLERIMHEGELALLESQRQIEDLRGQIMALQVEIRQSQNRIQTLKYQWQQRALHAPISGTVFQLPVQNAGSVVQAGQMVAQIAPENAPLVLRAQVSSRESGFLETGLPVKLKFDAYPFQDYGIVAGEIVWIAPDSRAVTNGQSEAQQVYDLEVAIADPQLRSGNQHIALVAGQTARAEIILRQRRVLDLLIEPLQKMRATGVSL